MDKESPEYFIVVGIVLGLILLGPLLSEDIGSPYERTKEVSPEQDVIMSGKIGIIVNLSGIEYVYQNQRRI